MHEIKQSLNTINLPISTANNVKTTVILKDELAEMLQEFSTKTFKSKKKMSEALNFILADFFCRKKDLFGSTKLAPGDSLADLRDKRDRFD